MKFCKHCRTNKEEVDFFNTSKGLSTQCKKCTSLLNVKKRNNLYKKEKKQILRKKYNLSYENYSLLLAKQNYKCKICYKQKKLCVDHCHKTGKVRGLLCNNCNLALGLFYDSKKLLDNAKKYLRIIEKLPIKNNGNENNSN